MNDLKDLKNNITTSINMEDEKKNVNENDINKKPLTLGSSSFGVNNTINLDDNPYDTFVNTQYFGKISDNKNDNNTIDISIQKDIINNNMNNMQPINVEKKVYTNPTKEIIESEIKPLQGVNTNINLDNNKDTQQTVIVEKKTYCGFVNVGKDGINNNINANINDINSNINKYNSNINNINPNINSKDLLSINEISFYLSGGDFLHKKINILEETLMKNSEMYNYVIDKYEKDSKLLKEEIENLKKELENSKNNHKNEIEKLTKEIDNYKNRINDLSSLKNDNQGEIERVKNELNDLKIKYNELLNIKNNIEKENIENKNINNNQILELKKNIDELKIQLNKKDIENEQLKKTINEFKIQKEKEFSDFQKQIKDITALKDQEISMLNDRIKNEQFNQNDRATLLERDFQEYKINTTKMNNELRNQNNELKRQTNEIPLLRQEIEKYKNLYETIDNENAKMHGEFSNLQDKFEIGRKLNEDLNKKINDYERKLNSDPYFAREIMSKTLYKFATRIMMENN